MLTATHWTLRALNWLNWIVGVLFVLGAGYIAFIAPQAFRDIAIASEIGAPDAILLWLRVSVVAMVPMIWAIHIISTRLGAIVDSVAAGAAFSIANAGRLRTIAWALLATQAIDLVWGLVAVQASEASGEYLGWSFALTGWLAALMLFILARVFRDGARMREELEGTV